MRFRYARARISAWWRPTLVAPVAPRPGPCPLNGGSLLAYRAAGSVVLVTVLGEFVVPAECGVSVLEVQHAVAWIQGLPVAEPARYRS